MGNYPIPDTRKMKLSEITNPKIVRTQIGYYLRTYGVVRVHTGISTYVIDKVKIILSNDFKIKVESVTQRSIIIRNLKTKTKEPTTTWTPEKAAAEEAAAKKAARKMAAAREERAKKAAAKKATPRKKATPKKATAKKTTPRKKAAPKKATPSIHVIAEKVRKSLHHKHRTSEGDFVLSKGEVIVAEILTKLGLQYEYEKQLYNPKNSQDYRKPDFTIHHNGKIYYWEHLGMLSQPNYKRNWESKYQWYIDCGFGKQLIISRDAPDGSIDSYEIEMKAKARILS